MIKKIARQLYREKRKALSAVQRQKMDDLILIQFQRLPLPELKSMLSYHPLEQHQEPNTQLCTDFLEFRNPGLEIAFPRTNTLTWDMAAIGSNDDTEFELGPFDLVEPAKGPEIDPAGIDLILVPLLAHDISGYRVGFGKGVYDRFLSRCRPDCIKVGLSYFAPIEKIDDRDEFDVPLNFSVTPETFYVF